MKRSLISFAASLVCAAVVAGCGGSAPPPAPSPFAGNWAGTWTDTLTAGEISTITLSISTAGVVSGTVRPPHGGFTTGLDGPIGASGLTRLFVTTVNPPPQPTYLVGMLSIGPTGVLSGSLVSTTINGQMPYTATVALTRQ